MCVCMRVCVVVVGGGGLGRGGDGGGGVWGLHKSQHADYFKGRISHNSNVELEA